MSLSIEKAKEIVEFLKTDLKLPTELDILLNTTSPIFYDITGGCVRYSENVFEVVVDIRLKTKEIVHILAHEMRHVYQLYNGIYKMRPYRWNNKIFLWDDYYIKEHPHERDANTYMKQMLIPICEGCLR